MATTEKVIVFLDGITERISIHGAQDQLIADIGLMKAKLAQELMKTAKDVPISQSEADEDNDEVIHINLLDAKAGIAQKSSEKKETSSQNGMNSTLDIWPLSIQSGRQS